MYKNRRGVRRIDMGVEQFGAGGMFAFTEFYRRELDQQVRRASELLRSDSTANDVVHDAMVEMYARWSSIREPGGYLNRAVLNRCRDVGRRVETQRRFDVRFPEGNSTSAPETPLADLFDRLPFNDRAALVLRHYADLSIAEIAEALGCPQGSVGPWIDRGLKSLKEQLG